MSSYSPNLKIELITPGTQAGVWGDTTNTNLGTLIEQAISGIVTQTITNGADTVITMPDGATGVARNMVIECVSSGNLTANRNLIVPANKKLYFIFNNTTGGYAVTVKVSGQTGVSVPMGAKVILMMNSAGTDIVTANNYMVAATLLTPALDAETYSTAPTVTAGTAAQDQGPLTKDINIVTTTAANPSGVTLPTATTGRIVTIVNKGTNPINIYPTISTGIDNLADNLPIQIPVDSSLQFVAAGVGQWYSSATGDTGSGAVVRQTAPNLISETYSTSATVSAAGTAIGDATALTSDYNIVTTVASGAGVILPVATVGRRVIVVNRGANALNIYPVALSSIDLLAASAPISLPVNGWVEVNAATITRWYSTFNAFISSVGNATNATNALNLVTTNFTVAQVGTSLTFVSRQEFTGSITSTTMTVNSATTNEVLYGAALTGTGITGGTTVGVQLTSTEAAAASPTRSSGGAVGTSNFVVSSASGIAVGQMIDGTGVPSGTYVGSIYSTTVNLVDRTGAAVDFTIQATGTYNFRPANAEGSYTVSASSSATGSITITGTKTVARITNAGLISSISEIESYDTL